MPIDESVQGIASGNLHNRVLELLEATQSSARVLDAPCGAGVFARRVAAAGFDVVGIDVSAPQEADFEFHRGDVCSTLPLGDGSVDVVTSIEGVEHLERPFEFVRECHRVLATDGTLIITTPNISALRSRWRWFWTGYHNKAKYALDEKNPSPMHHINMLSFPALRYLLHSNGFTITTVTTNRIKPVSWLYAPLVPLVFLSSAFSIAGAKRRDLDREQGCAVMKQMMSVPVLFGECFVVVARKNATSS